MLTIAIHIVIHIHPMFRDVLKKRTSKNTPVIYIVVSKIALSFNVNPILIHLFLNL